MSSTILSEDITEEALVVKASSGDLDAFNHLVEAYQDLAYHHAWTFMNDYDLAADVTQESFIKAFKSIKRFRRGSFRAWLLKIVANTAYDHLRRRKRRKILPLTPERDDGSINNSSKWLVDPSPSVEETIETKEAGLEIYRMVDELPEIYRMVLILVDVYDFEYQETAEALNVKVGTVKSRLRRARLKMRDKLRGNANVQLPRKYDLGPQLVPVPEC
jgi:RNA polymerase sigma-70 factor (ECF subfamily)